MKEMQGQRVKVYERDGRILFGKLLTVSPSCVTIESNGVLYHLPVTTIDRMEQCL